jgi:hypothetical protein
MHADEAEAEIVINFLFPGETVLKKEYAVLQKILRHLHFQTLYRDQLNALTDG